MAPKTIATGLLALATLSKAATNQKRDAEQNVFLPPQPTGNSNIFASVITAEASTTEYFLACETAFTSPEKCDGAFTGVTLTHGPATMDIKLAGTEYHCSHGDGKEAVCQTKTGDVEAATTLAVDEAEAWMTPITVVDAAPTGNFDLRRGIFDDDDDGDDKQCTFCGNDDDNDNPESDNNNDSSNDDSSNEDDDDGPLGGTVLDDSKDGDDKQCTFCGNDDDDSAAGKKFASLGAIVAAAVSFAVLM